MAREKITFEEIPGPLKAWLEEHQQGYVAWEGDIANPPRRVSFYLVGPGLPLVTILPPKGSMHSRQILIEAGGMSNQWEDTIAALDAYVTPPTLDQIRAEAEEAKAERLRDAETEVGPFPFVLTELIAEATARRDGRERLGAAKDARMLNNLIIVATWTQKRMGAGETEPRAVTLDDVLAKLDPGEREVVMDAIAAARARAEAEINVEDE